MIFKFCDTNANIVPYLTLSMAKLEIGETEIWGKNGNPAYRYSEHEVDIHCRSCFASLGHIIHICSKRLTTVCGNCGQVQEIQTNIMARKGGYEF